MTKVYEEHLRGETGQPYLAVFFGFFCFFFTGWERLHRLYPGVLSCLLYEITWILYQLCHLGPITWATDEQDGHGSRQRKERTTLYTAAVFILRTGPVPCSQNPPDLILNVMMSLWRTLLSAWATVKAAASAAAAADVNNAQSCCWLLIVIQRNSCVTAKSVICFMDKTKWIRRESQAARWCMTHRSLWPCSHRLWQFNISEKSALSKKTLIFSQFMLQHLLEEAGVMRQIHKLWGIKPDSVVFLASLTGG